MSQYLQTHFHSLPQANFYGPQGGSFHGYNAGMSRLFGPPCQFHGPQFGGQQFQNQAFLLQRMMADMQRMQGGNNFPQFQSPQQSGYYPPPGYQNSPPPYYPRHQASPHHQLRNFQNFNQHYGNGSTISPRGNVYDDRRSTDYTDNLLQRQSNRWLDQVRGSSPREKSMLRDINRQVEARAEQMRRQGQNVSSGMKQMWIAQGIMDYGGGKEGFNNSLVNETSRYIDTMHASNQGHADSFMKWGQPLPQELRPYGEQSIYNPYRERPANQGPPPRRDLGTPRFDRGPVGNAPAGNAPAGNAPAGNAPAGNAPAGNAPAGNAPAGNAPAGNAPAGNAPAGNAPAGNAPAGNAPAGNAPAGNAPAGNAPAGNAPAGNAPAGNAPAGNAPAGNAPAGNAPAGNAPAGNAPAGNAPAGNAPAGNAPAGNAPAGNAPAGNAPAGNAPAGNAPAGNAPAGNAPAGNAPAGNAPAGNAPAGNAPAGNAPAGNAPAGNAPAGNAPAGNAPAGNAPAGNAPAGNAPAGNAPAGNAPAGNAPAGNAPAGNAPAGNAPAGNAPAVNAPAGNAPAGNAPAGNAPAGNAPAGNAPAGNAPAGNAPAGNAPAGNAPAGNAPAGNAPAGNAPAGNAPAGNAPAGNAPAGNQKNVHGEAFNQLANNFDQYDSNRDGVLDKRELASAAAKGGEHADALKDIAANEHNLMFANIDSGNPAWHGMSKEDLAALQQRTEKGESLSDISDNLRNQYNQERGYPKDADAFKAHIEQIRSRVPGPTHGGKGGVEPAGGAGGAGGTQPAGGTGGTGGAGGTGGTQPTGGVDNTTPTQGPAETQETQQLSPAELEQRQRDGTVQAAHDMDAKMKSGGIRFNGNMDNQQYNPQYWQKDVIDGREVWRVKDGVNPADAINDVFNQEGGQYAIDCAASTNLCFLRGKLEALGPEAFNEQYGDFAIRGHETWNGTPNGGARQYDNNGGMGNHSIRGDINEPGKASDFQPGDWAYFDNKAPGTDGTPMQGENTIFLGYDDNGKAMFFGNPVGIMHLDPNSPSCDYGDLTTLGGGISGQELARESNTYGGN